jgi:hypothetical protein
MDVKEAVKNQYYAALEMLKEAIVKCPDSNWEDVGGRKRFWHVAYHTLFYTHLYLQVNEGEFRPWIGHRENYQFLGTLPWPPHDRPKIGEPYSKEDFLEYFKFVQRQVEERVAGLDMDAESGFTWLPFKKLELQFYNIRHIQHHTAELIEWLGAEEGIEVGWRVVKPGYLDSI